MLNLKLKLKSFLTFFLFAASITLTIFSVSGYAHAALILEGQLFAQGEKVTVGKPVAITLRIYNDEFAGNLLFEESQKIKASTNFFAFTFEKGEIKVKKTFSGIPAENLWVEVEYNGQIMSPRLGLAELGSLNELKAENLSIREAHLRTAGPATLVIDNNGVTLSGLLDMGSQSIKLGGVSRNQWLESRVTTLENDVATLKDLLQHFSRSDNEITISGANLHIVNGTGSTGTTNSLGNLIVGYNKRISSSVRTGSHNIVTGEYNNYSSYGGLLVGYANTISGKYASVSGGDNNTASGEYASVNGGRFNKASGEYATVVGGGGIHNQATGYYANISGGRGNTASGQESSVSGGHSRTAPGLYNWTAGSLSEEK